MIPFAMRIQDVGTWKHSVSFAEFERELAALQRKHPQLHLRLTGTTVLLFRSVDQIIDDLRDSLLVAGGVIFMILTIVYLDMAHSEH